MTDRVAGVPLTGDAGQLIRNVVQAHGFDPKEEVVFGNLAACAAHFHLDKEKYLDKAVSACDGYVQHTLSQIVPNVPVLLLGPEVQKAFGVSLIDRWEQIATGHWAIATHHPAYVLTHTDKMIHLDKTVQKLAKGLTRTLQTLPPTTFVWEPKNLPSPHIFEMGLPLALDTEGNTLDWTAPDAFIGMIGLGNRKRVVILGKEVVYSKQGRNWLTLVFNRYAKRLGGHNIKFDSLFILQQLGLEMPVAWDTIVMANLYNEFWYKGLKELATYYFNAEDYAEKYIHSYLDKTFRKKADRLYTNVPREQLAEYLQYDILYTSMLAEELVDELHGVEAFHAPYKKFEIPLTRTLIKIEQKGFAIDRAKIAEGSAALAKDVEVLNEVVKDLSRGHIQNAGSSQQVAHYLWDVEKMTPPQIWGLDPRSTSRVVLAELEQTEVIQALTAYRRADKIKGSYFDNVWKMLRRDAEGVYRVHPSYKQAHVKTGRLSAVDPAIQTIPRKGDKRDNIPDWLMQLILKQYSHQVIGDYGERIKAAYIAPPGRKLLVVDGSQWELRVIAVLSQDPYLLDAYGRGLDFHGFMCDLMFGPGQWGEPERAEEKRMIFALAYGGTIESAVSVSTLTQAQKEKVLDAFYNKLTKFVTWREDMFQQAVTSGKIVSPHFNRTFHFDLVTRYNQRDLHKFTVNWPVQGTASNITMDAAVHILPQLQNNFVVGSVHDSLIGEIWERDLKRVSHIFMQEMAQSGERFSSSIKWQADAKAGQDWAHVAALEE